VVVVNFTVPVRVLPVLAAAFSVTSALPEPAVGVDVTSPKPDVGVTVTQDGASDTCHALFDGV